MAPPRVTDAQLDELHVAIDELLRREPNHKAPAKLVAIHRAWTLDAEVGNGGFAQYLWNHRDTPAPRPTLADRLRRRTPTGTSPARDATKALMRLAIKDGAKLLAQARKRLDADPREKRRFLHEDFFAGHTSIRGDLAPLSDAWYALRPTVRSRISAALRLELDSDVTLTAAAIGGATWLVARRLGVRGARVDRTIAGHTLLEWATRANAHEVVQWLLDHGADPDRVGFNTLRPLHHAAMHNALDAAKLLLAAGADAGAGVPDWGDRTAAVLAREHRHDELATLLARAARQAATGTRGPASRVATKLPTAKRVAAKLPTAKRMAAKLPTAKRVAAKLPTAKRVAAKLPTAKRVTAKRVTAKRVTAKRVTAKRVTAKRVTAKRVTAKLPTAKRVACR